MECAGYAPKPGRRSSKGACAAIALGSALLVGSTVGAIAGHEDVDDPSANHAWGGCTLDAAAVDALESRINAGGDFDTSGGPNTDFKVSFVLVYALENDNDGQPLDVTGPSNPFTGVILCTNAVENDPGEVRIQPTTETTVLPNAHDHNDGDPITTETVDILDGEQTFVLQYQVNGGTSDGDIEKRVCHHTDSNTDCFRIFPLSD